MGARFQGPGEGTLERLTAAYRIFSPALTCAIRSWPQHEICCPPAIEHVGRGRELIAEGRVIVGKLRAPPGSQALRDTLWSRTLTWWSHLDHEATRLRLTAVLVCLPRDSSWVPARTAPLPRGIDPPPVRTPTRPRYAAVPAPAPAPLPWVAPASAPIPGTPEAAAAAVMRPVLTGWVIGVGAAIGIAGVAWWAWSR